MEDLIGKRVRVMLDGNVNTQIEGVAIRIDTVVDEATYWGMRAGTAKKWLVILQDNGVEFRTQGGGAYEVQEKTKPLTEEERKRRWVEAVFGSIQ